jgi:Protein of unknown function (DUF1602).
LKPSLVEPYDAVHPGSEPFIVRGDQRRAALTPHQSDELREDDFGGLLVEVAVGSSASISGGLLASALATATRCCSPPDNFAGR